MDTTSIVSETPTTYRREIVFDRDTNEYTMFLDGDVVGIARTYTEAEATLEQLIFELTGTYPADATTPAHRRPVILGTVYGPKPTPPVCFACEGSHLTHRCPELLAFLFADDHEFQRLPSDFSPVKLLALPLSERGAFLETLSAIAFDAAANLTARYLCLLHGDTSWTKERVMGQFHLAVMVHRDIRAKVQMGGAA